MMNFGTKGLIFCQRFVCPEYSMCAEDVSVSRRTGLLGWFLCPRVLVFVNGLSVMSSIWVEDVIVSRGNGLLGWFLGPRVLVFVNGFWGSSSICRVKISASAIEVRFEDDVWDTRDSVFINYLSVRSSLCVQKMSASAVELGFLDDFCVRGS